MTRLRRPATTTWLAFVAAVVTAVVAGAAAAPADAAIDIRIASPTNGTLGLAGVVDVAVTASADLGVEWVQLSVDGQPYGPQDSNQVDTYRYVLAWDSSTVAPGMHTLTVEAHDWSGATLASAPVTVGVGPAAGIGLTSPHAWSFVRGKAAALAASVTATPPASVAYAVDGTTVATAAAAPWSATFDSTSTYDGPHTVTATLTDAAGQTAADSATVTVDNTPPFTYLETPAVGSAFSGSLPVQAQASDAYGIATVQFAIDGAIVGPALTQADSTLGYRYVASLDISKLARGAHALTVVATDNAGNTAISAPVTFYAGTGAPSVAISTPVPWSFAVKTTTVTATIAGGTAPFSAQLVVDGVASATSTTGSFAWDTTKLPDGTHTIAVVVTDATGLTSSSPVLNETVDNTAPIAAMLQPVPLPGYGYARSNGPTAFRIHASDVYGISSVQLTVDGKPVGAASTAPDTLGSPVYTIAFDTSTLTPGPHAFSARVTDHAGNVSTAPPLTLKSGPISSIPVLSYHGILGPLDFYPTDVDLSPAQADAQLAYLKANGYRSVTLAQYQTWLATGTLPAGITKPVLITVDDGLTDEQAWDPLLQKYGFTGVMFVVTGFADAKTPGQTERKVSLDWAHIKDLAKNGRWEIAFHAGLYGHGDYSLAANTIDLGGGQVQSFDPACFYYYTCLGTITTTKGKLVTRVAETPAQLQTRIKADLTAGIAELKKQVPSANLTAWACPWNACGQWTTDYNDASGSTQSWLPGYIASLFPLVFTETSPLAYGAASGTVGPLGGLNRRYRFEVQSDTSMQDFAAALADPAFANN